ncbi:MAG TPA: hypothetical protein VFX22_07210 [Candidatus Kapabacteria bacterium]|nr:hypothetical protein [Candidatus Kapabacteria bacterium]
MIPDYKKLDEIDILIFGIPTPESDRAMTEYIKAHKTIHARPAKARSLPSARMKLKAKAKQ